MKKELQDSAYKINAYFEAIEGVISKMSGYEAYPIKALCAWGADELTTLENIIERMKEE